MKETITWTQDMKILVCFLCENTAFPQCSSQVVICVSQTASAVQSSAEGQSGCFSGCGKREKVRRRFLIELVRKESATAPGLNCRTEIATQLDLQVGTYCVEPSVITFFKNVSLSRDLKLLKQPSVRLLFALWL